LSAPTARPDPELWAAIEEAGWQVEAVEEGDEWWCRELWHLKSTWRPQTSEAFLCFLIDPQDDSRVPKPWAVKVSRKRPSQWQNQADELNVSCRGRKRSWIPGVMSYLGTLRNPDAV
jgi:hypothetical protein